MRIIQSKNRSKALLNSMTRFLAGVGLAVGLFAQTGFPAANDFVAELGAGGIVLARTGIVSIERERLFISMDQISVDYEFRNNSDEDVRTLVAFPMPEFTASPYEAVALPLDTSDNFMDFTVSVNGRMITPNLQQRAHAGGIDVTSILEDAGIPLFPNAPGNKELLGALDDGTLRNLIEAGIVILDEYDIGNGPVTDIAPVWTLKSAYWWEMEFPADQTVRVHHDYRPGVGGTAGLTFIDENGKPFFTYDEYNKKYCIEDGFFPAAARLVSKKVEGRDFFTESWISYVLTSGANWAGSIRNFELVIDKGSHANLVSFCGENVEKTGPTQFTMRASDFVPERDLDILFMVRHQ